MGSKPGVGTARINPDQPGQRVAGGVVLQEVVEVADLDAAVQQEDRLLVRGGAYIEPVVTTRSWSPSKNRSGSSLSLPHGPLPSISPVITTGVPGSGVSACPAPADGSLSRSTNAELGLIAAAGEGVAFDRFQPQLRFLWIKGCFQRGICQRWG